MTSTEERLTGALHTIADERPAPNLPGDLWHRGRRRRRGRIAAAVLAAAGAVVLAVPLVAAYRPDPAPLPPADQPPAVPRAVYVPVGFARTVADSPPGPAAVVVTGDFGFQDGARTLVVGRDGPYRMVGGFTPDWAGEHVHLSPDGRRLAVGGDSGDGGPASVVDLVTGEARPAPVDGPALAWSPQGELLLLDRTRYVLRLADLGSGQVRTLATAVTERATAVAFSADGSLLALQRGATLDLIDVATGRAFRQLEVGRRQLAGPGAWTANGTVALWDLPPTCGATCGLNDPEDVGEFRLTLLDPGTAGYTPLGLDPVDGSLPRLLGWRSDGSAVVTKYRPPDLSEPPPDGPAPAASDMRIVALLPGGGTVELVDLPAGSNGAEVAVDLIHAGRFGGPPPGALSRVGETLYGIVEMIWPLAAVALLVVVVWRLRRPWSRRRAW